jgi:hypothetical protein
MANTPGPVSTIEDTINQLFSAKGLIPWWNATVTQYFNGADEKGTDYTLGGTGYTVGSLTAGRIITVQAPPPAPYSSLGYVVQVLNPDGSLIHYQHLQAASVNVGDTVQPGSPIGTQGGCADGNYQGLGLPCAGGNQDDYSTGTHIEVRYSPTYDPNGGIWGQNWIDPFSIFQQIATNNAGAGADTTYVGATPPTPTGSPTPGAGSSDIKTQVAAFGVKAALFLLALVLVMFGIYMLFKKQLDARFPGLHKALHGGGREA